MTDFKVVLPTTTEEWQRDMNIAYNQALEDFKEYLLRHKHLVREFETGHIYEAVKIEFITDTNNLFLK